MIQDEVLKLVQNIVAIEQETGVRTSNNPLAVTKETYRSLPKYRPTYADSVRQSDRIKVHSDPDYFPSLLFTKRSPNQTDEQFEYVKENYQCTTNPVWIDYQSVIGRSFIDTNWNIVWPQETDEVNDFRDYVEYDVPIYGSVEQFVTQILPNIKGQDANGVLAVRPYRFALIEDEDGIKIDDKERLEPTIYYHPSKNVLLTEDDYTLCVDDELSMVEVGDKQVKKGRVLYLYTLDSIFKIIQVGKKEDNKYAVAWQYEHDEGEVPATQLKGVPIINSTGKIYWVSRFYYAVPLLDLALTNRNILQTSINSSVFPFRVMMASECDFSDKKGSCSGGKWMLNETGAIGGTCPKCNGSGHSIPVSPLGTYLWEQPSAIDGNTSFPSKPVEYISLDTSSLTFVREQVEIDTDKAKSILHLQTSNSQVKGSENMTATGMAIDQKSQWAFIRSESDQLFDLWDWILNRMCWQRYDNYDAVPTVIRPQTFDFRTEQDIWNEIETARGAGAPPFVIHQLFYQLLTNIYATDPEAQAMFETVVGSDRLFALNDQQIALRKAANSIDPYEMVLHHSSLQLINELIRDDENYLKLDISERITKLIDIAKSYTFSPTNNVVSDITNLT